MGISPPTALPAHRLPAVDARAHVLSYLNEFVILPLGILLVVRFGIPSALDLIGRSAAR